MSRHEPGVPNESSVERSLNHGWNLLIRTRKIDCIRIRCDIHYTIQPLCWRIFQPGKSYDISTLNLVTASDAGRKWRSKTVEKLTTRTTTLRDHQCQTSLHENRFGRPCYVQNTLGVIMSMEVDPRPMSAQRSSDEALACCAGKGTDNIRQ